MLNANIFEMTTISRLVVGLGIESVIETSLALHGIHGFPIIPGSALKGLARAVAFFQVAQTLGLAALDIDEYQRRKHLERSEQTPLDKLAVLLEGDPFAESAVRNLNNLQTDPAVDAKAKIKTISIKELIQMESFSNFRRVFGILGCAGSVVFLDAMPKRTPKLSVDVMNPHYPKYYSDVNGQIPPSDDQSPNPVAFLTVEEDSVFGFAVAPRGNTDKRDVGLAQQWLELGLREVGIGAKTAAGYGVFD